MIPATALPGAGGVLCVLRGAAGCRLVRVALLVGGLFMLGVVCGERASAADGAPTSPSPSLLTAVTQDVVRPVAERRVRPVAEVAAPVTGTTVKPVAKHVARPVTERIVRPASERATEGVTGGVLEPVVGDALRPVTESVVRPVTESVVRPVTEGVVVPVGDLVESVTGGLGGVTSQLPQVTLPSLPGVPGLPELPPLPGLPEWNTLPVESLPVGGVPQESGPREPENPGPASDGGAGHDTEGATGPASVTYGPKAVVGGTAAVPAPHRTAGDLDAEGSPGVRVPARHAPDGVPTGALGRHSSLDNGGPRHAEPHAVAALDPAPLSLVPGARATDTPGGTRDRHRDIPESPG
ncbi:hypothetical protein E4N62_30580 [Streptomyces sp. MNU76]|uniref:hypothetical protein n=1 Tax=Streptomyces sp. MNU76 TaxID=2560026 RepID=UPI001E43351C|nr:hypothetical protein [Streptomyces sp. MNU76]MCC9709216.1 hypothetical protein [Streptomyces sp. MNU76]